MWLEGSCQCEKVRFRVQSETPVPFMFCFCSICRKTTGGAFGCNIMGRRATLKVTGAKYLVRYHARIRQPRKATVISDGEPDSQEQALAAARRFDKSDISTVYVGPEGGAGQAFLARLAAASGGQSVTAAKTAQLAQTIERFLLAAGS